MLVCYDGTNMRDCTKLWEDAQLSGEAATFIQAAAELPKDNPSTYTN